jgi:hypothetical protein
MKRHPLYFASCYVLNALMAFSFLGLLYGLSWEIHTISYLHGFSDAVIPASATPEQQVESILRWMETGPARHSTSDEASLDLRDPQNTLNYRELLDVCGTATNAFVNLASSSGLKARRLLLLSPDHGAKHVVAEVWLNGRWAVVDPSFRILHRTADGQLVTRAAMQDEAVFRAVTADIPDYSPSYTYERTAIVRLEAIPFIGARLRGLLDRVDPGWEEQLNWTLLLERESLALTLTMALSLMLLFVARVLLGRYGFRRLNIAPVTWRERIRRIGRFVLATPGSSASQQRP